jgi:biopolymer transport protein ExbD
MSHDHRIFVTYDDDKKIKYQYIHNSQEIELENKKDFFLFIENETKIPLYITFDKSMLFSDILVALSSIKNLGIKNIIIHIYTENTNGKYIILIPIRLYEISEVKLPEIIDEPADPEHVKK